MRTQRDRDKARRQRRKRKLRYLRQRLTQASDPSERKRLIEKIQRISSTAPVPEE
jgi:hypothetical protein